MANILTGPSAQLNVPALIQGNVVSESAFPSVAGGSLRFTTAAPGVAEGRIIRLRASARVTGGTTTNYTLKIYWWNSVNTDLTTFTSDVNILTSGALAFNTVTGMLFLQADLAWDSISTKLNGSLNVVNSGTTPAATWVVATAAATVAAGLGNLKFFATGLFSATNGSNAATLFDLSVDVL